nr:HD-GYP domain-containing protein [Chloroflexota bacterium]
MKRLRPAARLYILVVVVAALISTLRLLVATDPLTPNNAALALVFGVLVATVNLFPLSFAYKRRMSLDSAVIFAAVLLFDPGIAILIAGLGCFAGDAISSRLRAWSPEMVFNASQTALQAGAGALVLILAGWDHTQLVHEQGLPRLLMTIVAAFIMYMVNTMLVAGVIGLQSGQAPFSVWRQSTDLIHGEQLSEFALGLLAAVVLGRHPWALPLLIFPAIAVYHSLERHVQLRRNTIAAVESMADIIDIRDPYTANHSRRVAEYSRELATALGLGPDEIDLVETAARVHDVGKTVVDVSVLTKQGKLTNEEWHQLRQHPITGAQILSRFPQFSHATTFVRHHHERIDGLGYPDGLKGDQIPLGARIIAVADAFDAMSCARPYRSALANSVVLTELRQHRGTQWDAHIVDTLMALVERERILVPRGVETAHPST